MDNQGLRKAILDTDLIHTETSYSDEEIYESLRYKPTLDNGGLKCAPSEIRSIKELDMSHDLHVFTKEGEFLSFKKYDILKKLLNAVKVRLHSDESVMPTDDDRYLYRSVREQLEFLCNHNTRLIGIAIKTYFKKRPVDSNRMIFESDANYALFIAVEKFDHTRGYKFSTYYITVAHNQFKSSGKQIKRLSNVIPAGIRPLKSCNKRLQAEHGLPYMGLEDLISTELSPPQSMLTDSVISTLSDYMAYLTKTERMAIEEYYINNQSLHRGHRSIRQRHHMSKSRFQASLRSGLRKLKRFTKLRELIWR